MPVAARQDLYRKEEHGTLDGHHQSSAMATQKANSTSHVILIMLLHILPKRIPIVPVLIKILLSEIENAKNAKNIGMVQQNLFHIYTQIRHPHE